MKCDAVLKAIPLYFYGELSAADEDGVEQHVHGCAECAREMDRQRGLAVRLDRRQLEVPLGLLESCRADLMAAIQGGAGAMEPAPGPWRLFLDALSHSWSDWSRYRQPAAAAAMLTLVFFAGRYSHNFSGATNLSVVSPSDQVFSSVRSVQPESNGGVQISFDETRRKVVSGRMDDQNIQQLLLSAVREDNPAVRVESVEQLVKNRAASGEVRAALLNAVAHDPNAGVRLKAVEGLKSLAVEPDVRKVLAQVLLDDDNSAVRMQVIDLLAARPDDSIVGVLQNLMQKEDNSYVRLKTEKALKDMNASVGTF